MNTNRLSVLGGAVLIALLIVIGYLLGIAPKIAEGDATVAQQQVVDAQNVTQQSQLEALRLRYSKIADLRKQYAALQTAVPLTANTPDFVDQVKALADANGVTILSMTLAVPEAIVMPSATTAQPAASPQPGSSAAPVKPPVASSAVAVAGKSLVGRLFFSAVKISVGGTSAQVFGFLSALQNGQRLFLSDQVAVSAAGAAPGGTISGYILIVPPSSTAASK